MATVDEILDCIRTIVVPAKRGTLKLNSNSHLSEILDSFQKVLLVSKIEEKFGINIEQADLVENQNWVSPDAIVRLVKEVQSRSK